MNLKASREDFKNAMADLGLIMAGSAIGLSIMGLLLYAVQN